MSRHQLHLPFFTHAVPKGQKVPVNGTKTLLASAYQEHRTGKKEVSGDRRAPTAVLCDCKMAIKCVKC